jgi:hypothetical protein
MQRHTFVLVAVASLAFIPMSNAAVGFEQLSGRVEISLDGKPLTAFHYDTKWDKPFLYPLRTISGIVVSRGWPVEPRAGEQQDHAWHRGIWWGHGDINGEDFWREKPDKSTSRLVIDGVPKASGNSLDVKLAMITSKGKRIGTVAHRYTFRKDGSDVLIDAAITVIADAGQPLRFGDTEDGGFGIRLSDEFRQERGARLINSEGLSTTEQIWGKPAKWTEYSASVAGRPVSTAVLDHPSNLRHPTRWHARGYSLNAANPFALGHFTGDKKNDGSYTLPTGEQLRLRYLVMIHEGGSAPQLLEKRFASFASIGSAGMSQKNESGGKSK